MIVVFDVRHFGDETDISEAVLYNAHLSPKEAIAEAEALREYLMCELQRILPVNIDIKSRGPEFNNGCTLVTLNCPESQVLEIRQFVRTALTKWKAS